MSLIRQEIEDRLKEAVDVFGPVGQPGKFEGEDEATMYFWLNIEDGSGEDRGVEGELYNVQDVEPLEAEILGLPDDTVAFVTSEDNQGFVSGSAMNKARLDEFEFYVSELEEAEMETE